MKVLIVSSDSVIITILRKIIFATISNCSIINDDRYSKIMHEYNFDYDVIIVDGNIIGTSGCEVINILRGINNYSKTIIYLYNSEQQMNKALKLGADIVIEKPVQLDYFALVMSELQMEVIK